MRPLAITIHVRGIPNLLFVQPTQGANLISNVPHNIVDSARTIWFTVAGSDQGTSDAQAQFQAASANPAAELAAKLAARQQLNNRTEVSLPGDPALAQSVTWSKQD